MNWVSVGLSANPIMRVLVLYMCKSIKDTIKMFFSKCSNIVFTKYRTAGKLDKFDELAIICQTSSPLSWVHVLYKCAYISKWKLHLSLQRPFREQDCHRKYRCLEMFIPWNIWEKQLIHLGDIIINVQNLYIRVYMHIDIKIINCDYTDSLELILRVAMN